VGAENAPPVVGLIEGMSPVAVAGLLFRNHGGSQLQVTRRELKKSWKKDKDFVMAICSA
jgi:hypothetical protein